MPEKPYVIVDDHGVYRVAGTRVMLDSVVAEFRKGHSPETIQQAYPGLSLEEVYGAITYYLAHRQDVDDYLDRQERLWERLRAESEADANPVVARLRALKSATTPGES